MASFLTVNDRTINLTSIDTIDCSRLEAEGKVSVQMKNGVLLELQGAHTIDIVMRATPRHIEGKHLKWGRNGWTAHNLINHPLLQVLAWVGLFKIGLLIHDITIPRPRSLRL
jgi:hypothetical protein